MTKIVVIPDTQMKKGVPMEHLLYAGRYIAEKKPDVIVHLGDHWDMPSLSSYDKGKKSFEGRRYKDDVDAGNLAMDLLLEPIKKEMKRLKRNKKKLWQPRMVFTMGNHEERIERAVESDAVLEDVIGYKDLNLDDWEVIDYKEPVIIEGVGFCHFFTKGLVRFTHLLLHTGHHTWGGHGQQRFCHGIAKSSLSARPPFWRESV